MEPEKKAKMRKYNKMKHGEYELHVLIQATSGLSLQNDCDVDAMISLTAFGETQYTKVKENVGYEETFWGEHVYFNYQFTMNDPIHGQRLVFAVWDHNRVLKNSLIGNYEVDIQRIYSEKDHCIKHMWLALSNVEKDLNEIMGYIKVSMSVTGESDDQVELDVEPIASITKEKKVLMPPHIERKTYQLTIELIQGRNLKPVDGKTVDSYIGVEFGQIYIKTDPVMKTTTPTYGDRVYLPLALPAVTDNIVIRIGDFNFIQKQEILGSYYININKLLKGDGVVGKDICQPHLGQKKLKVTDPQWINFYGPQMEASNEEQKNVHQFFPELATYYVGSILARIKVTPDSNPERKTEKMAKREMNIEKKPTHYYAITAKITAALNLFDKDKKYAISIRVGMDEVKTDFVKCKNGFCFWGVEKVMYAAVEENQIMPDIFVYLIDDERKSMCYLRYTPKEGEILQDKWVNFKPDLAVVKIQSEEAGYLKIGLSMEKANRLGQFVTKRIVSPLARIFDENKRNGKVVVELISAESLIPLDDDGTSDPFFLFSFMQTEKQSSRKQDTLNPIFFEKVVLDVEVPDEEGCPPIIVNVYDKDKMSRDFIGTAFIDVGDGLKDKSIVYGDRNRPRPRWFQIKQNGIICGKFLASFILLPNHSRQIPPHIKIPRARYSIRLFALGLRGLKSTGVISIKKPFIEFDYENLNLFGADKKISRSKNVITEPKQSGRSVNLHTVNKTVLLLPQNENYWPSLSAKVKDYILGGVYEPTIGYFSIDLQKSFEKTKVMKSEHQQNKKVENNRKRKRRKNQKLEDVDSRVLMSIRNFILKSISYDWKINTKNLKLNKIRNSTEKLDMSTVVVFPSYQRANKKENEVGRTVFVETNQDKFLANEEYISVGYDDKQTRKEPLDKRNKHYRYCLDESYEQYYQRVFGLSLGICGEFKIRKGRVFPAHDTASSVIRKVSTQDTYVGLFKGECFITKESDKKSQEQEKFQTETIKNLGKLLRPSKVFLFLYVIEACNLPPRDQFSNSDPYLIIRAGEKKFDLEEEAFENETNPQFYRKLKIPLNLPADSMVDIQVWDYDPIKADELIGSTTLDVENRLFSEMGSVATNNPIETHRLMATQSKIPQGLIRFWADFVHPEELSVYREFNISQKAAGNFELRVIVWSCSGMPNNDIEDMNDLFVVCKFNDQEQQTDVHYRSSTGEGFFNWRMVFPVKLPIKNPLLSFRVYDRDLITGNDLISSGSINIAKYLNDAFETDTPVALYLGEEDLCEDADTVTSKCKVINGKKSYDRFQINLRNKMEDEDNDGEDVGRVQISVQILPEKDAKKRGAGLGREKPNQHPHLPEPHGRFQWSLNPLKMATQICGKGFQAKIALALCCLLCIGLVVYLGASFGGAIIGAAVGS